MADINYNQAVPRPDTGWKPRGFLAGMAYGTDRARYDEQAGLQDIMTKAKAGEWFADAPVRETGRLKDIATNTAEAATVGPRKHGEVEKLQLGNQYDKGTLSTRIADTIRKSGEGDWDLAIKKTQQGLSIAAMMAQAAGEYGPAGAANMVQQLKSRGIDVQNDPVVNYVMSAPDRQQQQARLNEIWHGLSMADQGFRTQRQRGSDDMAVQTLRNQGGVDAAGARTSHDREHEIGMKVMTDEVKEQNPTWSPAKVAAEAYRRFSIARSGIGRTETSQDKANAKEVAELKAMLPLIKNPQLRQKMEAAIRSLEARGSNRVVLE
jgi:hypothetical protein